MENNAQQQATKQYEKYKPNLKKSTVKKVKLAILKEDYGA